MIILETDRLLLRRWKDSDRNLFREINADPKVMQFFPFRRTYEEADLMMDRVNRLIDETGLCFYAVELKETEEPIGFCGLSDAMMPDILTEGTIEIGWRLATRFWGHGYATEAARGLLGYGFKAKGLNEIVSFAVATNHRSTAVMQRLGMIRDLNGDFDHPRVPDTHPHLKPHVLYRITKQLWASQQIT
ncbi:GNAT family N-acetyltransferase [Agrobacterium vitis]|uniref:GNAT family N-acetyltransferase n=1 Tax=Agrobacterium vitis TaxID=373 RepID=A0AAE2RDV0_AGRVI|nr:GNAT family N-acetyltransferase [Agrobacterium vitis]MBF2715644.1 GNAT family N-acetyltransferase [Agrobacterium vitis]MUZ63563.1 GNAT family N-acetyltransferase [Agrobacterium vitis]MVA17498.1 GNAT family N-acetyltransferase [Agrobacterium vitis]